MSRTEHLKGKIREIKPTETESLQDIAKTICDELGYKQDDYGITYYGLNNFIHLLCSETSDYQYIGDRLFYVLTQTELDDDEDIAIMIDNGDGTFDYEVKFYNGGVGFDEILEKAFDNLNKK